MKKKMKKTGLKMHTCSVCYKDFKHQKPETMVGMLGIIPVQFCKKCFPKVMAQSEELNLNDTRLRVV